MIIATFFYYLSQIDVTTRQGINYVVTEKKIPLYLKALTFITRDVQMRYLVKEITLNGKTDSEKIESIFQWTISHILPQPKTLPVVDDHPWHIVIRGYGKRDQINDIFSILCSYLGLKTYFDIFEHPLSHERHQMALIHYKEQWIIFDVCHQTYFISGKEWASLEQLKNRQFAIKKFGHRTPVLSREYYVTLFSHYVISEKRSIRTQEQVPYKRVWIELKRWLYGKNN